MATFDGECLVKITGEASGLSKASAAGNSIKLRSCGQRSSWNRKWKGMVFVFLIYETLTVVPQNQRNAIRINLVCKHYSYLVFPYYIYKYNIYIFFNWRLGSLFQTFKWANIFVPSLDPQSSDTDKPRILIHVIDEHGDCLHLVHRHVACFFSQLTFAGSFEQWMHSFGFIMGVPRFFHLEFFPKTPANLRR